MKTPHEDESNPIDTANKIADAITWLSRVASEAGFEMVGRDLLTVRDKLEATATDRQAGSRH